MSESLDGMPLGVYVYDVLMDLRADGAPDVTVARPPVVLPCEAHVRAHGHRSSCD